MVGANINMATARVCSLFLGLKTMTDFCEYGINLRVQELREFPCYSHILTTATEKYDLLGCKTPQLGYNPTFRCNISSPSSGSTHKTSEKPAEAGYKPVKAVTTNIPLNRLTR
jgi:hypothetical protein